MKTFHKIGIGVLLLVIVSVSLLSSKEEETSQQTLVFAS